MAPENVAVLPLLVLLSTSALLPASAWSLPSFSDVTDWSRGLFSSRVSQSGRPLVRRALVEGEHGGEASKHEAMAGVEEGLEEESSRRSTQQIMSGGPCYGAPDNFTQDLVNQIESQIYHLIDITPRIPKVEFLGHTCSKDGKFTSGNMKLCLGGEAINNGLWRSSNKQAYGLFAADITCPSQANASGLVTTFYLTSDFNVGNQDEIDFEFLNRYNTVLQINNWSHGKSVYFKNVFLPFNCASGQKNYAIFWTPQVLIFFVDFKVVAWFPNWYGGPSFPSQPSWLVGSFWDGSSLVQDSNTWCGFRDSSTYNTEFIVSYNNIRMSKPILSAMCPEDFITGTKA